MSFLYEYMSEDELLVAQENARLENELLHINNEYEVLTMEHAVKLNDIELSTILENATDEDLTSMYEQEMIVYQEGVAEIWEKFKAWVKGIVNAILGKANKVTGNIPNESKDKEIELNVNPSALQKLLNTTKSAVRNIGKFKDSNGKLQVGKIAAEVGATVVGAGGIAALFKPVREKYKATLSKWADWIRTLSQSSKELGEEVSNATTPEGEDASTIKSLVSTAQNAVSSAVDTIKNGINSFIGGGDTKENETPDNQNTNTADSKESEKGEQTKDNNGSDKGDFYSKKIGKVKWRVNKKNGIISRIENGKETKVPKEQAPNVIRQVSETYSGIQNDKEQEAKNPEDNGTKEQEPEPQKTEKEKRVAEAHKAAENGVTLRRIGKTEWRIDKSTGEIVKVEDGKESVVSRDNAPSRIRQISQRYFAASKVEKEKDENGTAPSPVTDPNTKRTFTIKGDGKIVCKEYNGSSKIITIEELPAYMKAKNMRKQFKKTYKEYMSSNKNESSLDLDLNAINDMFMESPFYMTYTEEGITLYEFNIDGSFDYEEDDTIFTEMDLDDIVAKYQYIDESVGTKSEYEELMSILDDF